MAVSTGRRAVIYGVNGQDGSLLAEQLAARDYVVLGLGRQSASRYVPCSANFYYQQVDLCEADELARVLAAFAPDRIYHLAAVHGAAGYPYEAVWGDALAVNVGALHVALEHARLHNPELRIGYASSAKVFGSPLTGHIDLATPRRSECLYSITKNSAEALLDYYQRAHGIHAAVAYLFNHESARRGAEYFIPTVIEILRQARHDPTYRQSVRTLDFYCDWGSAREYMAWFHALVDHELPRKLIFASGHTHYGRDFVHALFALYGLEASRHIHEVSAGTTAQPFTVGIEETVSTLGWQPSEDIFQVCEELLSLPPTGSVLVSSGARPT